VTSAPPSRPRPPQQEWSYSEPDFLRGLSEEMHDLPDRRRQWLLDVADRLEVAGFRSFSDVPPQRFDEIAQLY
jgi:hypothetical protein